MEIYYCKNENELKRVSLYIFKEVLDMYCLENALENSGIYLCDYINNEEIESCDDCKIYNDECLLISHIDDKDILKHIELKNENVEYPCIVCFNGNVKTICSISNAKLNTKYGYDNDIIKVYI